MYNFTPIHFPMTRSTTFWFLPLLIVYALLNAGCTGSKGLGGAAGLLGLLGTKPELSTLLSLVNGAGLGDLLKGKSPLTLLAPTNDAFKALPAGLLSSLTEPGNKDKLTNLLKNHLIAGALDGSGLAGKGTVQNLLGKTLQVSGSGGRPTIGGLAKVQESFKGKDGFINVIDQVLLPE